MIKKGLTRNALGDRLVNTLTPRTSHLNLGSDTTECLIIASVVQSAF